MCYMNLVKNLNNKEFIPFPECIESNVLPNTRFVPVEIKSFQTVSTQTVSFEPASFEQDSFEPVSEESASFEPASFEPASFEPVSKEPVSEESASFEPVSKEPVSEESASFEPASFEPASKETASKESASKETFPKVSFHTRTFTIPINGFLKDDLIRKIFKDHFNMIVNTIDPIGKIATISIFDDNGRNDLLSLLHNNSFQENIFFQAIESALKKDGCFIHKYEGKNFIKITGMQFFKITETNERILEEKIFFSFKTFLKEVVSDTRKKYVIPVDKTSLRTPTLTYKDMVNKKEPSNDPMKDSLEAKTEEFCKLHKITGNNIPKSLLADFIEFFFK